MSWVEEHAEAIAARAPRDLEALVEISSPSGDVRAGEEAAALATALAPDAARVEHLDCSTPDHARDLLLRVPGTGRGRILLLGHLDTVVAHEAHEPLRAEGDRLVGSGSVDMKGGDVLALGTLRALASRPQDFAEVALLLVQDEEWRVGPFAHTERFAGWQACLCFEAGELDADGNEAVVVRRKAAGTIRVTAAGRSAHSGSQPHLGRNALLALSEVARRIAAEHAPDAEDHLTSVPTVLRSGDAFNVVPAAGELIADVRASHERAFDRVIAAVPGEIAGVTLTAEQVRVWPGMDTEAIAAPVLAAAAESAGAPISPASRGGASDASHIARGIPLTIDGLGPRGGRAHAPGEYVLADSLLPRARVALALADAALKLSGDEST